MNYTDPVVDCQIPIGQASITLPFPLPR
jgi:hypothetical protein